MQKLCLFEALVKFTCRLQVCNFRKNNTIFINCAKRNLTLGKVDALQSKTQQIFLGILLNLNRVLASKKLGKDNVHIFFLSIKIFQKNHNSIKDAFALQLMLHCLLGCLVAKQSSNNNSLSRT